MRGYRIGDRLRQIDRKTTARARKPILRDYPQEETRSR
ncbi:DUF58 domain-containing protein [Stenotrophomonas sp. YIM B06876]|nr:DUF58 domain-containing protein [Stenotrophomonas sp. YIM B06876]